MNKASAVALLFLFILSFVLPLFSAMPASQAEETNVCFAQPSLMPAQFLAETPKPQASGQAYFHLNCRVLSVSESSYKISVIGTLTVDGTPFSGVPIALSYSADGGVTWLIFCRLIRIMLVA
jgi:hypothetical protein